MPTKPYLIFDAGGTLVFPDFNFLAEVAHQNQVKVDPETLFDLHCRLILELDMQTRERSVLVDPFHNGYAATIFQDLVKDPIQKDKILNTVAQRDRRQSLWTSTYPWVGSTLAKLKEAGYAMSVVSNSDGRAAQILAALNFSSYFDQVFDSTIIGFSKPDVRLFQHALKILDLAPEMAIYIGDVYFIDVYGANQAGIGCIHLDPGNLYQDWPGIHLPSVAQLVEFLESYPQAPGDFDLFPARDLSISF